MELYPVVNGLSMPSEKYLPENNQILIDVKNPDKHSPQHAGLLLILKNNGESVYSAVKRLTVPLGTESRAKFVLPLNLSDSVELYAIEPQIWMYPRSIASEGDELIWEEKVWGLECRQFKTKICNPEKEFGAVEWRGNIDSDRILFSIALKGILSEGARVEMVWRIEGVEKNKMIITPEMIKSDEYIDFTMVGNGKRNDEGILRISFIGGGDIRLSSIGLFSIETEFLEKNSLWHKTIILKDGQ